MKNRIASLDVLRGVIMVIMALDHVRDFFSNVRFSPTDLALTTPGYFFTRWITHFCAPVFVFLAGTGAFFYGVKENSLTQLSRFLWTRGVVLIAIEVTIMYFGTAFNLHYNIIVLLVFWLIGCCMIVMAALVHLPVKWIAAIGILLIVGHNALDSIGADKFGAAGVVWMILHQPGIVPVTANVNALIAYPLIPWVGVMAMGYVFGRVFQLEPARRQKIMLQLGIGLVVAFILIRAVNIYGDPVPWSSQKNGLFTLLSFLNTNKYPPSLSFLLMTLGPALILLSFIDKGNGKLHSFFQVYGRVPLFYYVVHFYLIHLFALIVGVGQGFKVHDFVQFPNPFPVGYGFNLWGVYAVWMGIVVVMYPLCKWYGNLKGRSNSKLLSYL
ncbi:MAG: DUF1624 domain-containing protein [Chitinophaga sp.]|uniref:DUF1624 domain-containing protein n=1 Tax=Chitinophaga sp. TaxID=1869181 RepID=UPI001B1A9FF2|nr:heparan-alpha-glucosaminide N-acetyltransferase domain-containing protein [Chitinophaga sp.]MBO9730272.1 DUF1624 domain-containing protein [Chitinophaga sp.]